VKAIRFTQAEADFLADLLSFDIIYEEDPPRAKRARKIADGLLGKLKKAQSPSTNVPVAPIEEALMAGARGKVVALLEGHAQASVQAGRLGVTPDKAYEVGQYLARTKWLTGPFTLLDVLMKWPTYHSKAQATLPPPSAPAGFGGVTPDAGTRQGTQGEGQGATNGRRAPGFR
jgi:hypothetical protein